MKTLQSGLEAKESTWAPRAPQVEREKIVAQTSREAVELVTGMTRRTKGARKSQAFRANGAMKRSRVRIRAGETSVRFFESEEH